MNKKLFEGLKESIRQAVAIQRGEMEPAAVRVYPVADGGSTASEEKRARSREQQVRGIVILCAKQANQALIKGGSRHIDETTAAILKIFEGGDPTDARRTGGIRPQPRSVVAPPVSEQPGAGEVLPCPFCGTAAKVIPDDSYGNCAVACTCEAEPMIQRKVGDLNEAIAAWNRRAAPAGAGQDPKDDDAVRYRLLTIAAEALLDAARPKNGYSEVPEDYLTELSMVLHGDVV